MSTQKVSYSVVEKECLNLLNWLIEKLEIMQQQGEDIGPNGSKMIKLFIENKDRIEARAINRVRQAEEWKRVDLTDTDRGLLKESIEAGKQTDAKLIGIQEALFREKFKLLNWGKTADRPKSKGKKK